MRLHGGQGALPEGFVDELSDSQNALKEKELTCQRVSYDNRLFRERIGSAYC